MLKMQRIRSRTFLLEMKFQKIIKKTSEMTSEGKAVFLEKTKRTMTGE